MKTYDKYKDTDIDWLPSIPENWKKQRIKTLFSLHDERNFKHLNEVNLISLYTSVGVIQHTDIDHTTGNKARNADGYKIVNVDDIIVNIMLCWMGAIGRSAYNGVTSPAYDVYTPHIGVNSSYYHYLFRTPAFSQQCFRNGHGIMLMRWRTYSPQFTNISVPVPPLEEQTQIVRFLDWKVSEINKLIALHKRQISALKEYKEHKVTAKLYGEKVWLKWLLREPLQYGANSSGVAFGKELPRYIRITDIDSDGNLKTDGAKSILREEAAPYILADGDVLLARSGATVGKAFLYKEEYGLAAYAGYLIRAKFDKTRLLPEYFMYFTNSSLYSDWKDTVFIQATIQNISADKYGRLPIPLPSIDQQKHIVEELDDICKNIDILIETRHKEIKSLQELKVKIISDVVTGKMDVRGIEIPDYEFVAESVDEEMDEADCEEQEDEYE
jgi:type I restriction enzyme S subunit